MSETAKYNLYVEDGSSVPFLDWRKKINGTSNSNMVKIDTALAGLDSAILDTQTKAQEYAGAAENNAKSYTDKQIAAIPTPNVSVQIDAHDTNTSAHNDIRLLITDLADRLNALANSDDTTLDQMAEVVEYIKDNRDLIEQITTDKVSVVDIVDNLSTNVGNKPLSAAQGVVLKSLIDALTEDFSSHTHAIDDIDGLDASAAELNYMKGVTSSVQAQLNAKMDSVIHYGVTSPSNTKLLWLDTNQDTGGLKYYNGSAWIHVPMVAPVMTSDPSEAIDGQVWVLDA